MQETILKNGRQYRSHNRTSARDGPMFGSMGPSMNTSSLTSITIRNLKWTPWHVKHCMGGVEGNGPPKPVLDLQSII